ncbi:MAG: hypothetical protein WBI07_05245 [Mobilitalea sp.]
MLGKLFKHEFKATARLLLPLYLVLAVMTLMDRIVINLDIFTGVLSIIPGIISFIYVISIIAIIVVSFVIIILRFYKNLMTDEGYLMFTLPAKSSELINSKLFASMLWTFASVIGVAASIFCLFITPERFVKLQEGFSLAFAELEVAFQGKVTILIIEFILLFLIALINSILEIYFSIAIGQLFNGHKVLGSFGAYIVISTVIQILSTLVLALVGLSNHYRFNEFSSLPDIVMPFSILFLLVTTVIYYLGTDLIFKKKLNLE